MYKLSNEVIDQLLAYELEEITIPKVKVMRISEDAVIHITDSVYGTLRIYVLTKEDEETDIGECSIKMPGYSGENVLITVPKSWIGKDALVAYDRKAVGKQIDASKINWSGDIKIEYAPKETAFYHIYKIEQ